MNPLTVLVAGMPVPTVMRKIERVLHAFEMPFFRNHFTYKVDSVFPTGFAQFTILIWSVPPTEEEGGSGIATSYYVEVMRTVGERIMVIRFFEKLKMALESVTDAAMEEILDTLNVFMLDWTPIRLAVRGKIKKKLASALLALCHFFHFCYCAIQREDDEEDDTTGEDAANGHESMLSMLSSPYDDVVADGCSAVAKLAVSYKSSRRCLAASPLLVKALVDVILSDDSKQSCVTRTNAALALKELTVLPVGQKCFWAVCTSSLFHALLAEASTRMPERTYNEWLLQRYWYVFLVFFYVFVFF